MPSHHYVEDPGIRLEPSGMLAGWVFGVPKVFFSALDIHSTRSRARREKHDPPTWLRRVPPVLSFKTGDVFYEPPEVRTLEWTAALRRLRRCVQVMDASPDRLGPGDGTLVPGALTFAITDCANGRPGKTRQTRISQAAFERLLRTGVVP
jgi:hypothetical protein